MNPLVTEFKERIQELKKLAGELKDDFYKVDSPEESLIIERVAENLEDAERDIQRVVYLEEKKGK